LCSIDSIRKECSSLIPFELTADILDELGTCHEYFMRSVDRVFIKARSYRYHQEYYHELLRFWLSFFDRHSNIKTLLMTGSPHFPWEYVMYYVARYHKIHVLYPAKTALKSFLMIQSDIEGFGPLESSVEKPDFHQEPVDLIDKEAVWIQQSKELNKRTVMVEASFFKILKQYVIMIRWLLSSHASYKNSYFRLSSIEHSFYLLSQIYRDHKLISSWNKLVYPDRIKGSYIYYALPFQPEQTTDPNAHNLSDAYLSLIMLSKGAPEGFKIVIKEHPAQAGRIHPSIRARHYRTKGWYDKMSKLPNVIFAPWNADSQQLIKNCELTAALTGGTVWEGMLIGKPGLLFGDNWHVGCDSSPIVQSSEDIKHKISRLQTKSELDVRSDVLEFVNKVSKNLVESEISDEGVSFSSLKRIKLVDNMADALIRRFV